MADSLYDPAILAEAEAGFKEFSAKFAAIAEVEETLLANTIRFLRRIPTTDGAKKRELAKFFRSDLGSRYGKEERRAAYNELLGELGNRKLGG